MTVNRIHDSMLAMADALEKDPETKDRYGKASFGAKEWLCYSRWISKNRARWDKQESAEYRDSLTSWLGTVDMAYVLQFETKANVVGYLKDRIVSAIDRENSPARLNRRRVTLQIGLHKPWDGPAGMKSTSQVAAMYGGGCGMICQFYSAMKGQADYLRGDSSGAMHWTHPDHQLYIDWRSKYYTSRPCRVQQS